MPRLVITRKRARSLEQLQQTSNLTPSAGRCSSAFALTATIKFTMKLLSMCAPETIRPLAAHNMNAIINGQLHNVRLPNLHEVEQTIRMRNSHRCTCKCSVSNGDSCTVDIDHELLRRLPYPLGRAADADTLPSFQIIPPYLDDCSVNCDYYLEPEWSDPPTDISEASSLSPSSTPSKPWPLAASQSAWQAINDDRRKPAAK